MLKIENLSKKFPGNDFYSLKDVSMTIGDGEIVGLIGKNGAGKSTLMKMIAKSQAPTHGTITYNGTDIFTKPEMLSDFGIMISPVFYPELSVVDNLKFYLKLHKKTEYLFNIESTLKLVGLWDARHRKPKGFSFGMKQRTALAIALVAEPDFLILDEPFVGLDPIGVQNLIDILKKWSEERQISMLISSHQLSELESLCDRYVYIDKGELADEFVVGDAYSLVVTVDATRLDEAIAEQLPNTVVFDKNKGVIEISSQVSNTDLNALFELLGRKQVIQAISLKDSQLKELFKKGE